MDIKKILSVLILIIIIVVIIVNIGDLIQGDTSPLQQLYVTFTPVQTVTPSPVSADEAQEEGSSSVDPDLAEVIPTRTPAPTATPDALSQQVSEITRQLGIQYKEFLGLSVDDWLNLFLSLMLAFGGYLVGTWVIRRALPRVFRHYNIQLGNEIIAVIGEDIRWIVVLLSLNFATNRLTFLSAEVKKVASDIFFVGMLWFATIATFKLVDLATSAFEDNAKEAGRYEQLRPVFTLISRIGKAVIALLAITILLSYFGINVTGLLTVLGLGGLAISLAAQDTIADAIAGFIILIDQPFRVGDRIEIEKVGTWGDVVDIGLRTTRIRTRDNRMVIVPNSIIGSNEVINYTYPDPRYRIQTHVDIAYGSDIEGARELIIATVGKLPGVLQDKPVDALYIEMGDFAMKFRVRWWVESYVDTRRMLDHVHTSLDKAFEEAGIESPFPTQYLIFDEDQDFPQLNRRRKDTRPTSDDSEEKRDSGI